MRQPILSKTFWRYIWFAIRRTPTDNRARRALLLLVAGVMAMVGCLTFYGWYTFRQFGIQGMIYFYLPVMLLTLTAGWLVRRSHQRSDEMLSFSITGREPSVGGLWKPNPEVVKYMVMRAKILSAMVLRGAGEICIHHGMHPPGTEPNIRQLGNTSVRAAGLWDELAGPERNLMALPDGAWPPNQEIAVVIWSEQLRLLRWTLGIDSELEPLTHFFQTYENLHRDLAALFVSEVPDAAIRIPSAARAEREIARGYFARVLAEMNSRRLLKITVDVATQLEHFRTSVLGDSTDFLAGQRTVAELKNEELPGLATAARARMEYANYLTELLSAAVPFPFPSGSVPASFQSPDH